MTIISSDHKNEIHFSRKPLPSTCILKMIRQSEWFHPSDYGLYINHSFKIHRELVELEGIDPKSNRYYNEIDKRIYDQFYYRLIG